MQTLNLLINEIKKDGKISSDDMITILSNAVSNDISCNETYKTLYKKAYGNHLSKETCELWVKGLDITDDSERNNGEKWSIEKTTDVGTKMSVDWQKINKYEWYAAMNAFYSDFYKTAKDYELEDDPEFFASLVMDYFINDTDAHGKSVFCYYFNHVI